MSEASGTPWGRILLLAAFTVAAAPPAADGKPAPAPAGAVVGEVQALEVIPALHTASWRAGSWSWRHSVAVPGAAFLKPRFADVDLRPEDRLRVYAADGALVEEIRGRGPRDAGRFWGLSAPGDSLTLELIFQRPYPEPPFRLDRVVVGDAAALAAAGVGGQRSVCGAADFEDVICYQPDAAKWANVQASAGVMTVDGDPGSGAIWCSGVGVSPWGHVLTSAQCLASAADCADAEIVYGFRRGGCNDGSPPLPGWQGFRCEEIVTGSPFADCEPAAEALGVSLLAVEGDPVATYGWAQPDATPPASAENVYIVQHPAGRPQEIVHGGGADFEVDGLTLRYFGTLDTEAGSPGAPIFRDADDLLVGVHHCGGCESPAGNRGVPMSAIAPLIAPFLCTAAVNFAGRPAEGVTQVVGNDDAVLDPGETWRFTPVLRNRACAEGATGVSAQAAVGAGSAGPLTLLDTAAAFGDIPATADVASAPLRFALDSGAPCGGQVVIDLVSLTADSGGPFADLPAYLTLPVGAAPPVTLLAEDFAAGIPAGWTVVDGGSGGGPAATWTTDNPGSRDLDLEEPFAIADSDALGAGATMDEELITPVVDAAAFTAVELAFVHDFAWFSGGGDEHGDVDVRSAATGGVWTTVASFSGADTGGPVSVDLTAQAAGQADVEIRFRYHDAAFDFWWAVDDIEVRATAEPVCQVVEAIFVDGFESGDTSAWGSRRPE